MYTYYIGVGSNIGDRYGYLQAAVTGLARHPDIYRVHRSSWYDTPPWGNVHQERFLNGVIKVSTSLQPEAMLDYLHILEQEAGRTREIHWGPRTLDLDIVWAEKMENLSPVSTPLTWYTDTLQMPHPYFWDRLFVLEPLAELYPQLAYNGVNIYERIRELKTDN